MLDWKDKVDGDEIIPDDINLVANELIKTQKEIEKSIPEKQPLDFVINVTTTADEYNETLSVKIADKTFSEVLTAYGVGKRVYLLVNGVDIVPLSTVNKNNIYFNKPVFGGSKGLQFGVSQSGWVVHIAPDLTNTEMEELVHDGDDSVRQELLPRINAKADAEEVYQRQDKVFIDDNKIKIGSGGDPDAGGESGDVTIEQGRIKFGNGSPYESHTTITEGEIRVGADGDNDNRLAVVINDSSITFHDGDNYTTDDPYISASEVKIINSGKVHKLSEKADVEELAAQLSAKADKEELSEKANAADVAQKLSAVEAALDNKADKEEWRLINEVELTEDAVVEFTTCQDGAPFNLKKVKILICCPQRDVATQPWLSFGGKLAVYTMQISNTATAPTFLIQGEYDAAFGDWFFETMAAIVNRTSVAKYSFPLGHRYSGNLSVPITDIKLTLSPDMKTALPAGTKIVVWGVNTYASV